MTDENDKTQDGKTTETSSATGTGNASSGAATPQTGPRAPLSLKPRATGSVSTGTVRQSFSHGRTKTVVVETKRRAGAPVQPRTQGFDVAGRRPAAAPVRADAPAPRPTDAGGLSSEEQEARRRAIEAAQAERAAREKAEAAERAK
ncbi:MAG TPA: translation initiation factor IF-2, partial [Brevundimonas sp.]|nr:translation initiation factor IF-2 [Brevundimonas sp.]